MTDVKLKPCPFCGSDAHKTTIYATPYVRCDKCGVEGRQSIWNARVADSVEAEINRLRKALIEIRVYASD